MPERRGPGLAPGSRRSRGAATLALITLLLPGCGDPTEPLAPSEAVATYDAAAEDVLAAATSVRELQWERRGQQILEPGAADCRYQAGIWEADGALYPEPGQGMDWDPWREALDPVLAEHGFAPLGREQQSGGDAWLESEGANGARLLLSADGTLRITDIRVEAEPCEDAALGL